MITIMERHIIPAAFGLLPRELDTPEARAFVLAVAMQQTALGKRYGTVGGQRGLWLLNASHIGDVLRSSRSSAPLQSALAALRYETCAPYNVFLSVGDNDVLACAIARLLLATLPTLPPARDQADIAYRYYLEAWRPSGPRPEAWEANYGQAWDVVAATVAR